ncbi:unnamed protein product [Durusdinium trenchii]|uniref:Uncharacterized protein n=1 Tax=Durusdinium trenchii TaxID=1381693 RepID=A0ABP0SXY7_9DINO
MARQGRSSSPRSGHGIACSLLLLGALQGVPFVGRAPFHESLAAQGTLLRAADQEVEALLAQAKALREEAERDEAAIRAAREAEEAEAAAQAAEAAAAAQDLAALQAAAQRATELAEAATDPVAQARAAVKAAKAKLDIAKLEAAGVKAAPSAPPSAGANPSGRLEDVKLNFSGTVMTQAEWEDLSEKFKGAQRVMQDMNLIEQFQTNSKVGPQVSFAARGGMVSFLCVTGTVVEASGKNKLRQETGPRGGEVAKVCDCWVRLDKSDPGNSGF